MLAWDFLAGGSANHDFAGAKLLMDDGKPAILWLGPRFVLADCRRFVPPSQAPAETLLEHLL